MPKMLLSLPTELVLLILRECDPTTFLQLTFSCRALLEAALSNRQLIEHQLYQTPGGISDDKLQGKYEIRNLPYEYEIEDEDEHSDGFEEGDEDLNEDEEIEDEYSDEYEGEDENVNGDGEEVADEGEDGIGFGNGDGVEIADENEIDSEDEPKNDPDIGSYLSTRALFGRLLQRSYRNLFGAEFYCQRKLITFEEKVLDTRASVLECNSAHGSSKLVFKGDNHVYDIDNGLEVAGVISLPAEKFGTVDFLFTGHATHVTPESIRDGIYMLHRFKPFDDPEADTSHPFVRQAMQYSSGGNIFLECRPYYPSYSIIYSFPEEKDYEPIAFSSTREVNDVGYTPSERYGFAISWQHRQRADDHHVVFYNTHIGEYGDEEEVLARDDEVGITYGVYKSYLLSEVSGESAIRPTTKLVFNDRGRQMLHYNRGNTLYNAFQRLPDTINSAPKFSANACQVRFSDQLSLQFAIDIPFYSTHKHGRMIPDIRCHWQYLAIGIATHRVEHWTVACLLRSEAHCRVLHCNHEANLDRGRRFDQWEIMARLDGYHELNTSHGSLITASHQGTRIAAASWKTVTVWALRPNDIIFGDERRAYPESWRTSDGVVLLQPHVIELDAVVFQLEFPRTKDENELWAITDRGLMVLNLKPDQKGGEVKEELAYDSADPNIYQFE